MAASSWNPLQPRIVTQSGGIPEILKFKEESSQVFKAGTPVKLDAGELEIATDGTVGFAGIAQEDASTSASTLIAVQIVRPGDRVIAKVVTDGTAALPTTMVQGMAYGWYIDSSSVFFADVNDPSTHVLYYQAPVYDVNGDSTYWGYFTLVPAQAGSVDGDDN